MVKFLLYFIIALTRRQDYGLNSSIPNFFGSGFFGEPLNGQYFLGSGKDIVVPGRWFPLGNKNLGKKILINLLSWTPSSLAVILATVLGRLGFWLHEKGYFKNYLPRALQRSLGVDREEAVKILKANFIHMARVLFEIARLSRLNKDAVSGWRRRVETSGYQHFLGAWEKGRGVILTSAHIGNFELLVSGLLLKDIPIYAVVWKQPHKFESVFLDNIREKFGTKLLYSQEMNTEDAVRILQKGGVILLVADYYTSGKNIVPFFGIPTHMGAGPIHYAVKSGAPIIPVCALQKGNGHQVAFEPPLELPDEGDVYGEGLKGMTAVYEKWIRSCPEQYFWLLWRKDWGKPDLNRTFTN